MYLDEKKKKKKKKIQSTGHLVQLCPDNGVMQLKMITHSQGNIIRSSCSAVYRLQKADSKFRSISPVIFKKMIL